MAQSKVTDYYSRRKQSSSLQPTKRSARNLKLTVGEITPAKCLRKAAVLPETLPVKTAALGTRHVKGGEVDLSLQLRAFNKSKSEANAALVSSILTRTFTGTTVQDTDISKNVLPDTSVVLPTKSSRGKVLEKTPLKRHVSDTEKGDPPRRKRTKLNIELDAEKNAISRTPDRSSKKSTNAAKIRRRLEPTPDSTGSQSAKTKKNGDVNPTQMKETLLGCGKLADLQARLALVKDTAAEIKRLQSIKTTLPKPTKLEETEKEKAPIVVPAFERYRHLIQSGPSSLALPFRYRSLEDVFRCSDTVVSMLHNRSETCTFSKLKNGVQEMSRKNFDLSHLKQIKTVYPSAYDMHWAKKMQQQQKKSTESSTHDLILEANLAGIPTGDDKDDATGQGSLMKGLIQSTKNQSHSALFDKFTPSMLIARRTLFHNGLVDIVKSHHTEYLAQLNPPIKAIPDEKLHRWHPKFPLDKIPEVSSTDLPEPPKVATFNSARDVLDKARQMMVNPKVTKALELVAKNTELKAAVEAKRAEDAKKKVVTPQPKKGNQALKGVSQDLLNRIKAKETLNSTMAMMRTPQEEGRIGMLERLPELCKILRVFFLAEKKAALPIDSIIQKLMDSYKSALSRDDIEKHIDLMVEILPDWLKKVNIRKTTYIKMDKTKELTLLINVINNQLKDAKKLK